MKLKKKSVIVVIFIIVLFLFINFLINLENKELKEEKYITKIIDGDTVIIEGGQSVRFLGIDCDERGKECYSVAKERIEELLLGKLAILEKDFEDEDQYGRKLRYFFLNNKNINLQMVKEGYCVARFVEDSKYKSKIQEAERFAIKNKIGCKWNK